MMRGLIGLFLAGALSAQTGSWWKQLSDPVLDRLMDRALNGNLDLRVAEARVAEAKALRGNAKSALQPSLDGSASASRLRGGFNQGVVRIPGAGNPTSFVTPFETGIVSGGLQAGWELDLFGGLRKRVTAADGELIRAEELSRDARVALAAEVARRYFEMRGAQARLAVAEKTVESQRDLLELTRVRADAGLATQLDVDRQAAELSSTRSTIPPLRRLARESAHRIGVLLGEEPSSLAAELTAPGVTGELPVDLPEASRAEVVASRPDLLAAAAAIQAQAAKVEAARRELYPRITLSGLMGRQSTNFSGLTLGGGNFFSIGPSVTLPFFNGGRIRSQIAAEQARLQAAKIEYERAVLEAVEQTENARLAYRDQRERRDRVEEARAAQARSLELSQELYTRGLSDFLSVLDAERGLYQQELSLAVAETEMRVQLANLHESLGRAW